mmetsp:Transcript_20415/g.54456  ORF Transcript_20415/g.54456 Transcript_20415/m.54456 type:complete len:283 (-) Transcript_20415:75-923(-)
MRRILVVIIKIILVVVARDPIVARHGLRARHPRVGTNEIRRLRERVVLEVRHLAFLVPEFDRRVGERERGVDRCVVRLVVGIVQCHILELRLAGAAQVPAIEARVAIRVRARRKLAARGYLLGGVGESHTGRRAAGSTFKEVPLGFGQIRDGADGVELRQDGLVEGLDRRLRPAHVVHLLARLVPDLRLLLHALHHLLQRLRRRLVQRLLSINLALGGEPLEFLKKQEVRVVLVADSLIGNDRLLAGGRVGEDRGGVGGGDGVHVLHGGEGSRYDGGVGGGR